MFRTATVQLVGLYISVIGFGVILSVKALNATEARGSVSASEDVRTRAALALGIDNQRDSSIIAAARISTTTLSRQNFPDELFEALADSQATCVVYDSVVIWTESRSSGLLQLLRRNVTVFLNPVTGALVRVEIVRGDSAETTEREKTWDVLQKSLLGSGYCFQGFPDSNLISFLSVIKACPFNPSSATRITGVPVLDSCEASGGIRTLWVISMLGIPPLRVGGPGFELKAKVPAELLDHVRVICDGRTGKPLSASN